MKKNCFGDELALVSLIIGVWMVGTGEMVVPFYYL